MFRTSGSRSMLWKSESISTPAIDAAVSACFDVPSLSR